MGIVKCKRLSGNVYSSPGTVGTIAIPEITDSDVSSVSAVATLCEIGEQIHSGKMGQMDKELYTDTVKTVYSVNYR